MQNVQEGSVDADFPELGGSSGARGARAAGPGAGGRRRSVDEPLTSFLPPAGCAPHVPVLHPVHLAALLGLATGLPRGEEQMGPSEWGSASEKGARAAPSAQETGLSGDGGRCTPRALLYQRPRPLAGRGGARLSETRRGRTDRGALARAHGLPAQGASASLEAVNWHGPAPPRGSPPQVVRQVKGAGTRLDTRPRNVVSVQWGETTIQGLAQLVARPHMPPASPVPETPSLGTLTAQAAH